MPDDIAVFLDKNGETASLYDQGRMVVYTRKMGKWGVSRDKELFLNSALGINELRWQVGQLLEFLKGCRVIVGLSIVGVPYFQLEKSGFSIWEFEGKPDDFLDYVLDREEEEREKTVVNPGITPFPLEISSGCYRVSIRDIQENNTGITSKQVLLPFLRKNRFYSLEVICSHVPPWLETLFLEGGFHGEVKINSGSEAVIVITPKCCHN